MTQPNLLNLAKQGDTRALTSLLNRSLQSRGITAKATKRDDRLHILLEGQAAPSQVASVRCIQQGLAKLSLVDSPVTIYGRQQGHTEIAWQEHLAAPIRSDSEDGLFEAELLEDEDSIGQGQSRPRGDRPELTAGEPTQASEDWSDQATAIESPDPLPPPPPSALGNPNGNTWETFDLDAAPHNPNVAATTGFETPQESNWGAGIPVDYSPEDPEPTLIVPDEGDDDMEAALNEEDADSEILLSLWDDANLDDDIEPSGDISVDNLELWQAGDPPTETDGDMTILSDEPMSVGNSSTASKPRKQGSSALPLLLLALLAVLGGVAAASYLRFINVPWLAKIPGVGPLLVPEDGSNPRGNPSSNPSGNSSGNPTGDSDQSPDAPNTLDDPANPTDPETVDAATTQPATTQPATTQPVTTTAEDNAQTDSETTGETTGEVTAPSPDPFREAVNAATQAANLAQTAASADDWQQVEDYWSQAVSNMAAVPSDHPRYDTAQEKVTEYQRYLEYAQQQR